MPKICFLGDVFAERPQTLLEWPKELSADCCFFNFEYVYDDGSLSYDDAAEGKVNLCGKGNPFFTSFPKYAVALANNHIMDYTDRGCEATVNFLDSQDVSYVGLEHRERASPRFISLVAGVTISSYLQKHMMPSRAEEADWRVVPLDEARVLEDAQMAHQAGSAFHVVYLHWGTELFSKPWPNQVELAHRLIDSGRVQMIIGAHSHCVQSYECYHGHWIFYGLGNAVFPDYRKLPSRFVGGKPLVHTSEYWGKCGRESLAVVLAGGGITIFRLRYAPKLGRLSVCKEIGKRSLRICLWDCFVAIFHRWSTAVRAGVYGDFQVMRWHLLAGWKSLWSYLATYKKLKRGL